MIRNNAVLTNILIETRNVMAKRTSPYYRESVHNSLVVARDNTYLNVSLFTVGS